MSKIYKGSIGLVGNTPLVEVVNIEKEEKLEATVLVKLESVWLPLLPQRDIVSF